MRSSLYVCLLATIPLCLGIAKSKLAAEPDVKPKKLRRASPLMSMWLK